MRLLKGYRDGHITLIIGPSGIEIWYCFYCLVLLIVLIIGPSGIEI